MTLTVHADTQRKLERLPEALGAEFPDVAPEVVRLEVETVTKDMVANARIEDFVPVLVHRFARDHLLALSRAQTVASQSWPPSDGPG